MMEMRVWREKVIEMETIQRDDELRGRWRESV